MMPNVTPAIEAAKPVLDTMGFYFGTQFVTGYDAARGIIASRGDNRGRLRASKPALKETIITRSRYGYESDYRDTPLATGAAAQVWRWVAFSTVYAAPYSCIPCSVDFDAPFDMCHEERRAFAKWCEAVADIITTKMPASEQHGIIRWGQALGML